MSYLTNDREFLLPRSIVPVRKQAESVTDGNWGLRVCCTGHALSGSSATEMHPRWHKTVERRQGSKVPEDKGAGIPPHTLKGVLTRWGMLSDNLWPSVFNVNTRKEDPSGTVLRLQHFLNNKDLIIKLLQHEYAAERKILYISKCMTFLDPLHILCCYCLLSWRTIQNSSFLHQVSLRQ